MNKVKKRVQNPKMFRRTHHRLLLAAVKRQRNANFVRKNEKPNEKLDQSANIPPDSFMNNPLFDQMLSNPELMLSMMPDSEEKKQMQEALKNPLFKSMLTNKELMKQMMQTAPPMNELQKKNN